MNRGIRITAASLLIVPLFALAPVAPGQSAKQKREAAYQDALKSYSDALKPGVTRKDVEDYLHSKGTPYVTTCCALERSASSVLVKIGTEKHPWYCSERVVYIAFVFVDEPHEGVVSSHRDSDKLRSITVYHQLEGCL